MKRHLAAVLATVVLGACSEGGSSDPASQSACIGSFSGASVQNSQVGSCSICGTTRPEMAVDGIRASYAGFKVGYGDRALRATAPEAVVFPAGNFAGALMLIPPEYAPQTTWTITTYLAGLPQETRTPGNADGANPEEAAGTDEFYGFTTTLPFDAVEVRLTGGVPALNSDGVPEVRFYEFCGDR